MTDKYTESRELSRKKPIEPSPEEEVGSVLDVLNTEVENVVVDGRFYFLNGYIGDAKEAVIIKSDLSSQVDNLEELTNKVVVGFILLKDGTIQLLMEG